MMTPFSEIGGVMGTKHSPPEPPDKPANAGPDRSGRPTELELLKVVVSRDGQKVTAQWGIHPQMKNDLQPQEWTELADLMSKVTGLVGTRFAEILADAEPDRPGTA
jgi:hypothetical protein